MPIRPILNANGISVAAIMDPDASIPFDVARRILGGLAEQGPDDLAIRLGFRWHIREFRLVGYAMLRYPTYGEFSDRWQGHYDFIGIPMYMRSIVENGEWRLEMKPWKPLEDPAMLMCVEEACASVYPLFRQLTGHDFQPIRIETMAAPSDHILRSSELLGAPIVTGSHWNGLVMPLAYRNLPLRMDHELLLELCARHCTEVVPELVHNPLLSRLRDLLLISRERLPSLAEAAEYLWMSPRSLNRTLSKFGYSYSGMINAFRRDLAIALLRTNELRIKELAFVLGFENGESLYRAFRQWTGLSIGDWSQRNLGFAPRRTVPS